MAGEGGGGGAAAAASLAGALIKAKSEKKRRKAEAVKALGEAQISEGEKKAAALKDILSNFKSALL